MKYASWAALVLLILSICSTLWIAMSVTTHLLLSTDVPRPFDMSQAEAMLGGLICMIVPITLAIGSFVLWKLSQWRPLTAGSTAATAGPWTAAIPAATAVVHTPNSAQRPYAPAQTNPAAPAPPYVERRAAPVSQAMILEGYIAEITELLVAPDEDEAPAARLALVQARTRQIMPLLDVTQRGRVLQILQSMGWLSGSFQVQLHDVDLRGIDLRFADLRQARLVGVNLQGSNLVGAQLSGANLSSVSLEGADLRLARLDHALLYQASLRRTRLHRAQLRGAILHGAQLQQANLWHADLAQAHVTSEQLQQVASLSGAILPDGTRHR